MKEQGKNLICDIAGGLLQAVGMWCFIDTCRSAPGGVSGIAMMISHLSGFPIGTLSLLINLPLFAASWLFLDRRMTWKTIWTVVWMSVILDGFRFLGVPQYTGDRLIAAAFGGVFTGAGMAVVFMRNSTTGGGDLSLIHI